MSVIKIKTEKVNRLGSKVVFPVLGSVEFDNDGVAEVDSDIYLKYEELNANHGLETLEFIEDKKEAKITVDVGVDEIIEEGVEILEPIKESEDDKSIQSELEGMELADLKDLCESSNYPKEEWEKKRKAKLIEYILDKIK